MVSLLFNLIRETKSGVLYSLLVGGDCKEYANKERG